MSTTSNDHNDAVIAQLKQLPATAPGERLTLALELGASPETLAWLAGNHLQFGSDDFTVVGLPYVQNLLTAGWNRAEVRKFLHDQCFGINYDRQHQHRQGFWNDEQAWTIFETTEQLTLFLELFAQHNPRDILTQAGHDKLTNRLERLCTDVPELQRQVRHIERSAVLNLTFVEDEYQLQQVIRYTLNLKPREQLMVAKMPTWGWSAVLRGFMLARHWSHDYERSLVKQGIYDQLNRQPDTAIALMRWLVEGFWREHNEYWEIRLDHTGLRGLFEQYGWHFLHTTATASGDVQVVLPGKGGSRTIVRHIPGDEPLEPGDEVMISHDQLKDLTPAVQPGSKLYCLTLAPLRRPSATMLADVHGQFPSLVERQRRQKPA